MDISNITPFETIYDRFLSKITDDMYLELTLEDTMKDLQAILLNSIPKFQFPRFPLYNYTPAIRPLETETEEPDVIRQPYYNCLLTMEEVDILAELMLIEWLGRQIASVENTRMKYSGSDFKFTSQANHLDKLLKLQDSMTTVNVRRQRLYKRRRTTSDGMIESNLSVLAKGVLSGNS